MTRSQLRAAIVSRRDELDDLREKYLEQLRAELPLLPGMWEWREAGPEVVIVRNGTNELVLSSSGSGCVLNISTHPGRSLTIDPDLIDILKDQLALEAGEG